MGQVNDNGLSPNAQADEKKAKYEKLQKTVWSDMKSRPFDKLGPGDLRAIDATYEKVMADEKAQAAAAGANQQQSSGQSAGAGIDAPVTAGNDSLPDGDESEDDGEPSDAPAF